MYAKQLLHGIKQPIFETKGTEICTKTNSVPTLDRTAYAHVIKTTKEQMHCHLSTQIRLIPTKSRTSVSVLNPLFCVVPKMRRANEMRQMQSRDKMARYLLTCPADSFMVADVAMMLRGLL